MTTAQEMAFTAVQRGEILRAGGDVRPGKIVKVEIDSRSFGAHAGQVVQQGRHVYDVHEADVPALERMVDPPGTEDVAKARFASDSAEWEKSRGKGVRPSIEASYRMATGNDLKAFRSVKVLKG
ncbi:MAG: hypothetical protein KA761_08880 [Gemmatimonadaceae bacterium]|nr:hypothetical protein [Gemmatimonadaceae bacterium]